MVDDLVCYNVEEFLRVRRRHRRRIRLPVLVFVCIGIIAYPSDHQTGKIVHKTSRLDLKAQYVMFFG